MLIWGSAFALPCIFMPWCCSPIWQVSLLTLAGVKALRIPLFIAPGTPNTFSSRFRCVGHTYIKQQVYVSKRRTAIIFQFDSTLDPDFLLRGSGWQTHNPKPSNWLLWDLLRGNMLPSGQRHTLFKQLYLSLFWASSPQLCLLASFHGNEKIYRGLK